MCHMFAVFTCVYVSLWNLKSEIKNKERIIGQSRIVGGGCRRLLSWFHGYLESDKVKWSCSVTRTQDAIQVVNKLNTTWKNCAGF